MRALLVFALALTLAACAEGVTPEGTGTVADAGTGDASTDAGDAGSGGSADAGDNSDAGGGALDAGTDAAPHDDAGADTSADAGSGTDAGADATADATTDAGAGADTADDARTDADDILDALRDDTNTLIDQLIDTQYARAQVSCDCRGDEVGNCMDHFAVSFDPAMACTREVAGSLDAETLQKLYDAMACELNELQTRLSCEDGAACDPDATLACTTPSPCEDTPADVAMAIAACVDAR